LRREKARSPRLAIGTNVATGDGAPAPKKGKRDRIGARGGVGIRRDTRPA